MDFVEYLVALSCDVVCDGSDFIFSRNLSQQISSNINYKKMHCLLNKISDETGFVMTIKNQFDSLRILSFPTQSHRNLSLFCLISMNSYNSFHFIPVTLGLGEGPKSCFFNNHTFLCVLHHKYFPLNTFPISIRDVNILVVINKYKINKIKVFVFLHKICVYYILIYI